MTEQLSMHMWTLSCVMWNLIPWLGIEPRLAAWEYRVLASGPLGKSNELFFFFFFKCMCLVSMQKALLFAHTMWSPERSHLFLWVRMVLNLFCLCFKLTISKMDFWTHSSMNFKTCMNEGNVTIQEWRSGVVWADEAVPYLRLKWLQKYQKYATLNT